MLTQRSARTRGPSCPVVRCRAASSLGYGLGSVLLLTACATGPRAGSWEEVEREGIIRRIPKAPIVEREDSDLFGFGGAMRPSAPHSRAPKTRPAAPAIASSEALEPEALELVLLRFTGLRQALSREALKGPRRWTPELERAWAELLKPLESALALEPGDLPRRLLIQTRVTLEVELEESERRFGPAPLIVLGRIRGTFERVAEHMQAARTHEPSERGRAPWAVVWPVTPVVVTSPFGYRHDPILGPGEVRFHAGIDLYGEAGAIVSATGPGRVSSAGWLGGHGRTVVVQHAGGYVTSYSHLKQILVRPGTEVDAGSPIGTVGSSGRSTGPHLHFEVRQGEVPIDPLEILGGEWSLGTQNSDEQDLEAFEDSDG